MKKKRFVFKAFGKQKDISSLIAEESWMWLESLLAWIPGRIGRFVRGNVYSWVLNTDGPMDVGELTNIRGPSGLRCGRRVSMSRGVQLTCGGGLTIGSNVLIGPGTFVITNGHRMDRLDIPMYDQGLYNKPVVIGNDVWLGANVVVLPGVEIGDGAVVAASSVVTQNVPPRTVVAGIPARVVKSRE